MAQTPPSKAPTGPKVSGTRTTVSLIFLAFVLVVCGIEVRAGLGQFLTLRAFNEVSENNQFKEVPFTKAHGMVAIFASKSDVQPGDLEDKHHYYWYSLLRPLMGKETPELFVWVDHSSPPIALSFSTSTEDEIVRAPVDPNAPPAMTGMPPGGMGMGMGGPPGGMGMGGPPGGGRPGGGPPGGGPPGGGPPGGGPPGGGRPGGGGIRPPLEDETKDAAEPATTEPATTEPATTEPATEPTQENPESETPAAPN